MTSDSDDNSGVPFTETGFNEILVFLLLIEAKRRPRSRERRSGLIVTRWNSCGFSWIIPTTARGPRCGMKYHPVWITSAETFVRCYRRSLIPPNYKSRCSSVGRYLPLTFSFLLLAFFRPPLSSSLVEEDNVAGVKKRYGDEGRKGRLSGERGPGGRRTF